MTLREVSFGYVFSLPMKSPYSKGYKVKVRKQTILQMGCFVFTRVFFNEANYEYL